MATHFAIHLPSTNALEEILEKVSEASNASLGDRLEVSGVFRPGDPGAIVDTIVQAFVKTDVFAAGLLCLSQRIELQAAANS